MRFGHAKARTFSRDSTSAERLNDLRNPRREGNKRSIPGPLGSCYIRPFPLICKGTANWQASAGPDSRPKDECDEFLLCSCAARFQVFGFVLRLHLRTACSNLPGVGSANHPAARTDPNYSELGVSPRGRYAGRVIRK